MRERALSSLPGHSLLADTLLPSPRHRQERARFFMGRLQRDRNQAESLPVSSAAASEGGHLEQRMSCPSGGGDREMCVLTDSGGGSCRANSFRDGVVKRESAGSPPSNTDRQTVLPASPLHDPGKEVEEITPSPTHPNSNGTEGERRQTDRSASAMTTVEGTCPLCFPRDSNTAGQPTAPPIAQCPAENGDWCVAVRSGSVVPQCPAGSRSGEEGVPRSPGPCPLCVSRPEQRMCVVERCVRTAVERGGAPDVGGAMTLTMHREGNRSTPQLSACLCGHHGPGVPARTPCCSSNTVHCVDHCADRGFPFLFPHCTGSPAANGASSSAPRPTSIPFPAPLSSPLAGGASSFSFSPTPRLTPCCSPSCAARSAADSTSSSTASPLPSPTLFIWPLSPADFQNHPAHGGSPLSTPNPSSGHILSSHVFHSPSCSEQNSVASSAVGKTSSVPEIPLPRVLPSSVVALTSTHHVFTPPASPPPCDCTLSQAPSPSRNPLSGNSFGLHLPALSADLRSPTSPPLMSPDLRPPGISLLPLLPPARTSSNSSTESADSGRWSIGDPLPSPTDTAFPTSPLPLPTSHPLPPLPVVPRVAARRRRSSSKALCQTDLERLERSTKCLQDACCYYPDLNSDGARALLQDCPLGTFLVRGSSDSRFLFAVSIKTERGPTSVRIRYEKGLFQMDCEHPLKSVLPRFETVLDLLDFHATLSQHPQGSQYRWREAPRRKDLLVRLSTPLRHTPPALAHLARVTVNRCLQDLHLPARSTDLLPLPTAMKHYLRDYPYRV
ncbi:uncharacterized protein LOC143300205 [Babylonia areolata]|uniref:uncharacterized protein LOC143300205 n=1 Tax=Babylonia areolata TaxID=304850 RepID=UPI003FD00E29